MKTAVLITGQARTFGQTFNRFSNDAPRGPGRIFDSQCWQVYRHLSDPHFFVSVANDDQAKDMELLVDAFGRDRVFIEYVEQPTLPIPDEATERHQLATPFDISAPAKSIMRQLWSYLRVWGFFCESAKERRGDFDLFMRIRPDLFFRSFDRPKRWPKSNESFGCSWGNFGGINDRFAIMGSAAAFAWFNAIEQLPVLLANGCPFHPETIQLAALERAQIDVRSILCADFIGIRLSGDLIHPTHLPSDIFRYLKDLALLDA